MQNKIYNIGQGIVYATLLLPLLVHDRFVFPFITPRNWLFRILVGIGLVVCAYLWSRYRELRPQKNVVTITLGLFVAGKFLSGFFGVNLYNSFWSNYERMEGMLAWAFFFVFYLLVITVFRSKEDWKRLLWWSLLPAAMVAIYGLGQAFEASWVLPARQSRIESRLGNAAYIGAYMLLHIGFVTYLYILETVNYRRVLLGIAAALYAMALWYSATRGAALGLFVGVLIGVAVYVTSEQSKKIRQWLISAAIVGVLLVVGMYIFKDSRIVQGSEFLSRMASISITDGTVNSRLHIWNMAYQGWKERPVFGWGQENFNYIFNKYFEEGIGEDWVDRAHNSFFDQLAMGGLVTASAYLLLLFVVARIFWQYRTIAAKESAVLLALWGGYVVQNQFVFDSLNTYLLLFLLLGYAATLQRQHSESKASTSSRPVTKEVIYGVTASTAVLVIVLFVITIYPGYKANTLTILALERANVAPQQSYEYIREALEYDSFGNKEIMMQYNAIVVSLINSSKVSDDVKIAALQTGMKYINQALQRDPNDARLLLFAAQFYQTARVLDSGNLDRSLTALDQALQINNRRLTLYNNKAQVYATKGDMEQAAAVLREAMNAPLGTKVRAAHLNLIRILQAQNKASEALIELEKFIQQYGLNTDVKDQLEVAVVVYSANNLIDKTVPLLEVLHEKYPTNTAYTTALIEAYTALGETELAEQLQHFIQQQNATSEKQPAAVPLVPRAE